MGRLIPLLLVASACLVREPIDRSFRDVKERTPQLTEVSVDCDAEAGKWTINLTTDAWTGGATSAWTDDGDYVEVHEIGRTSWAANGTRETLKLTLTIAEDFREVSGNKTIFTCARDPSGVLEVRDVDGAVVDCRGWGPDPAVFDELPDTPSCDNDLPVDAN